MLPTVPHPLTIVLWIGLPLGLLAGISWLSRQWDFSLPPIVERSLRHPSAPVVAGLITGGIVLYVWGSLAEPGVIHDERAYLLQARIFAQGRLTGTIPPLPEFFEQMHVLVRPTLAGKYPPVHGLVLAPGILIGLAGIMPLLLATLAGALVFALARHVAGPFISALTWLLWSTSSATHSVSASYLSETTNLVLWLLALHALMRWREVPRLRHVVTVSVILALMYLTRPLTAVGLGLPIILAIGWIAYRQGRWRQVAIAGALGLPVLATSLAWNHAVLDDWLSTPYAEYSRQYLPFDRPGFGVDSTPPLRPVPPEIEWVGQRFIELHTFHEPAALPGILLVRAVSALLTLGQEWRAFLIPLLFVSLVTSNAHYRFALISTTSVFLAYLIYAHPPFWIVYYAEVFPVFYLGAALGLVQMVVAARKLRPSQVQLAVGLVVLALIPGLAWDITRSKRDRDVVSTFHRTAERLLKSIEEERAVLFVRYPSDHSHHFALVGNTPDYRSARWWLVFDRGNDNDRLLALTDRPAYRLFTENWTLERIR